MGNKKIVGAAGILFVLLVIPFALDDSVFADKKVTKHTTDLIHLGYLQLAAHDFFNMDRTKEKDSENGLLDLSTVLFDPNAGKCDFEKSLQHK